MEAFLNTMAVYVEHNLLLLLIKNYFIQQERLKAMIISCRHALCLWHLTSNCADML